MRALSRAATTLLTLACCALPATAAASSALSRGGHGRGGLQGGGHGGPQDGDGPERRKKHDDVPLPPVADSNSEAAKRLRELEKGLADREPRLRAAALEPFLTHRHESYVKRLAAVLKDPSEEVALAAARALANQHFPSCTETLLDFATSEKNLAARPAVAAGAIRSLGAVGLGKKGYERLRDAFDAGDKAVKGAICQTFTQAKEKRAFSFFVDRLDAPAPENPDSPSNPPESYWRARHEEWSSYKQHVSKGLRELTGEKFTTAAEWREWAGGAGKKAGFTYSKGS